MILFFGMLRGYELSKKLLDVPIRVTPTSNKGAYLALGSDGLRLTANPDEIARINKKGAKKYQLLLRGTPVCQKKDKKADSCERGKNKSKNWNIKKGSGGYSIKSAKEKLMGLKQYCLTYDSGYSGAVDVKACRSDRKNQLFDLAPVEPEKETPEDDDKKDDDRKDADSDDENLSRDTFSSSEDVEVFNPNAGPKKEAPQPQPQTPPPYYQAVPQVPMYAYVPYVSPQPEQHCVCADGKPCVCPPGGNVQNPR